MRYVIRAWIIVSTFYTIFDVTNRLCNLYPGETNLIMVTGIFFNIAMNNLILNILFRDE